jgi:hypothetical protein
LGFLILIVFFVSVLCVCMCGKRWTIPLSLANCSNKANATSERDHLWNNGLKIKLTPMPTLVNVVFSKLLILLGIWCGVYPPKI